MEQYGFYEITTFSWFAKINTHAQSIKKLIQKNNKEVIKKFSWLVKIKNYLDENNIFKQYISIYCKDIFRLNVT